jgi:hypothetical protein
LHVCWCLQLQEAGSKARAEFVKLAAHQHSFAPDSAEYLQQHTALEAAVSSSTEQFLMQVQAAASRAATVAAAAVDK